MRPIGPQAPIRLSGGARSSLAGGASDRSAAMAFARMDDEEASAPRDIEQDPAGRNRRTQPRDVVAEDLAEAAGLEEIPLHVDHEQGGSRRFEREGRGLSRNDETTHGGSRGGGLPEALQGPCPPGRTLARRQSSDFGAAVLSARARAHNSCIHAEGNCLPFGHCDGERRVQTLTELLAAHLAGTRRLSETVTGCYARWRAHDDPAMFIALRSEAEAVAEAERLQAEGPRGRRLWGVPVAVKDNIDVAGLPTTAACPAFAYTPARDASAVARLRAEGAIVIGKTNLDQFATGLNGTRSPYGTPRNALRADLVPGGSSSGSASAVAAGIVPIALGTDTAGSGRVPAGLQNIVGLKPSVGLVPSAGVVPACRTLDCVSVFALTVEDAWAVLDVMAGLDPADPFSRSLPLGRPGGAPPTIRLGVPRPADRDFAGDRLAQASYDTALERAAALGAELVPLDFAPFHETARLLYDGPWVAERWLAIRDPPWARSRGDPARHPAGDRGQPPA